MINQLLGDGGAAPVPPSAPNAPSAPSAPAAPPSGAAAPPVTPSMRSANCLNDTAQPSAVCNYRASTLDGSQSHTGLLATCQLRHPETPDAVTLETMRQQAARELSQRVGTALPADAVRVDEVVCLPNARRPVQLTVDELHMHRMASNCAPTFDISNITAFNKYSCQYYGERVDEFGNRGYNLGDRMNGTLASCDAGAFDPRTEEDIRQLVAYQLTNGEFDVDPSKVRCDIGSFPA